MVEDIEQLTAKSKWVCSVTGMSFSTATSVSLIPGPQQIVPVHCRRNRRPLSVKMNSDSTGIKIVAAVTLCLCHEMAI